MTHLQSRRSLALCAILAAALGGCGRPDTAPTTEPAAASSNAPAPPAPLPHGAVLRLGTTNLRMGALVLSLAPSPDGAVLAAGDITGHVTLFDAADGHRLRDLATEGAPAVALTFSPDGRFLVATGMGERPMRGWELASAKPLPMGTSGNMGGAGLTATFSPDGRRLATWGGQTTILWDIDDKGNASHRWENESSLPASFDRTGKNVLCARKEQVQWCDVATGKPNDWFAYDVPTTEGRISGSIFGSSYHPGDTPLATTAVVAPGGGLLAICNQRAGEVEFLSPSGSKKGQISVSSAGRAPLAFTPDAGTLCVAAGNHVEIWSVGGQKLLRRLDADEHDRIDALAVIAGGKCVAAAVGPAIRRWDLASGEPIGEEQVHSQGVTGVAFSPDGMSLATVSADGTARMWDAFSGKPGRRILLAPDPLPQLAFARGGKLLAVWSGVGALGAEDLPLVFQEMIHGPGGTALKRPPKPAVRLYNVSIGAVAQATPGIEMVLPCGDGSLWGIMGCHTDTIGVWDANKGERLYSVRAPLPQFTGVAVSVDAKLLAMGFGPGNTEMSDFRHERANAGVLRVLTAAGGDIISDIPLPEGPAFLIALSPDAKALAAACLDGKLRVWDLPSGHLRFPAHEGFGMHLLFSPDSATLITQSGFDPHPAVLDAATGATRCKLEVTDPTAATNPALAALAAEDPMGGAIGTLVFSPDGGMVAGPLGGTDVGVWDTRQGMLLARLSGHSGPVHEVTFSPDGTRLASASEDTTVLVWDVVAATGRSPFGAKAAP